MVNFESTFSFDDSKLKKLQQKVKELGGQEEVSLTELMPDDFIREYTNFQTLKAMFDASGIENMEEIGDEKLSKFIAAHTRFRTWAAMTKMAVTEYIKHKFNR